MLVAGDLSPRRSRSEFLYSVRVRRAIPVSGEAGSAPGDPGAPGGTVAPESGASTFPRQASERVEHTRLKNHERRMRCRKESADFYKNVSNITVHMTSGTRAPDAAPQKATTRRCSA